MKFKQLLINIGIGVAGFVVYGLLQNVAEGAFWVMLIFAAIAAAGYFLMPTAKSEIGLTVMTDIFTYGCMYTFLALIHWISFKVLPGIEFNSFFKGLLLFVVSLLILSVLASFLKKGAKAIIAFNAWKEDPAWNFQTIAFGFLCLLGIIWWISGVVECGIAGALSFLGIVLAFVPNDILDAITSVPSSPDVSPAPQSDEPERITLEDGTVLTKEGGHWMDGRSHEWKEDVDGWSDQGFR